MSESPVLDSPEAIDAHLMSSIEPWERGTYGVRFVLCDADNHVRVHCPVDHLPPDPDPADCAHAISVFATALAEREGDGAMLVVLTRPGSSAVSDPDRVWFHAAYQVCNEIGVRLIGVHLMTPADQRRILLDDAL
nr:hypothetical protein [Micromonospora sp. DSM 115978]